MYDTNPVVKAFIWAGCGSFVIMIISIFAAGSNPDQVVPVFLASGVLGVALLVVAWVVGAVTSTATTSPSEPRSTPGSSRLAHGPHIVYRLYATNGALLYVGISNDVERRLSEHARTKHWWCYVDSVQVEQYQDRSGALNREAFVIRSEQPIFNVLHK